jgi:hypothetical protein
MIKHRELLHQSAGKGIISNTKNIASLSGSNYHCFVSGAGPSGLRGLRRRFSAADLLRLWARILPGAWISECCECCVLSGRGLCVGLITHPEESTVLRRCVWSRNLVNEDALAHWGVVAPKLKKKKEHPVGIQCVGWQVRYANWCLVCQNLTVRNEHFKKCHTVFRNWTFAFGKSRRPKMTSWIRLSLGKLRVPHPVIKFLTWYRTRNVITVFTYMCPELVLILSKMFTVNAVPLDFFKAPLSLLPKCA